MMDLMDMSNEIQDSLGRSYNGPNDINVDEPIDKLDALEADMGFETEADGVPSYLQPDKEPDLDVELNLPSAPLGMLQFQWAEQMSAAAKKKAEKVVNPLPPKKDLHRFVKWPKVEDGFSEFGVRILLTVLRNIKFGVFGVYFPK